MGQWIDLKAARQAVTMEQLLDRYGISARKQNAVQLVAKCPLPTHSSKGKTFCVNTERNIWTCKSDSCKNASGRKGGNCLDFVAALEKCSILDAAKKVFEWYGESCEKQNSPPKAKSPAHEENALSNPMPVAEQNKPLAWELRGITYHEYLEARGISQETAEKFGVGFFPGKGSMAGRVVIPIRNAQGELVAYAGRALNGDEPKYKLPVGFHKSHVLYNRHAVSGDAVTITEGFFSTMKVVEAGFPCVGLIGSTLSLEQEKLLRQFKYITMMLDPDPAGVAGIADIMPRLAKGHYVRIAANDKCPDEMTTDEIRNVLRYVCPI